MKCWQDSNERISITNRFCKITNPSRGMTSGTHRKEHPKACIISWYICELLKLVPGILLTMIITSTVHFSPSSVPIVVNQLTHPNTCKKLHVLDVLDQVNFQHKFYLLDMAYYAKASGKSIHCIYFFWMYYYLKFVLSSLSYYPSFSKGI